MGKLARTSGAARRTVRPSATVAGATLAGLLVAGVGGVATAETGPDPVTATDQATTGTQSPDGAATPSPEAPAPGATEAAPTTDVPATAAQVVPQAAAQVSATAGLLAAPAAAAAAPLAADASDPVDWVAQFPDAGLRAAVQDALQQQLSVAPGDAVMGDLARITYLDATNRNIAGLTGIGALTGLNTLYADNNNLTSLAGIEGLTALQQLNVANNRLTTLAGAGTLTGLYYLSAAGNVLTSLAGIEGLTALQQLDVPNNQLTSIDVSTNTSLSYLVAAGNPGLSPSVPFTRGGATQSFRLDSTGGGNGVFSMGGAYTIDGNRYTYVYHDGSGTTSPFFYGQDYVQGRVQTMGTTNRGVTNSDLFDNTVQRSEVRTVDGDGTVLHTVTVKNVSDAAITTAFHQGIDTELNGNDWIPLIADGQGGVIIRDDAMELYLQPVSGIERTLAGRWGVSHGSGLDTSIANGMVVDPSGRALDDVLATGMDSAVYYTTPTMTLTPGQTYTFSYRESLYLANDPYTIRLDYVTTDPETGELVTVAQTSREGDYDTTWDLTGLPGMPTGYELDPGYETPTSATYGTAGHLTTVTIHILAIDDTVDPTNPPTPDPTTPATPEAPAASTDPSTSPVPVLGAAGGQGAAPTGQRLPWTGAGITTALIAALAAAGAGTGLLIVRRRRNAA